MPPIDRLSTLPDEVLIHILSFLQTRSSVSTTILAKRWRFLWAHVPNIEFHSEFYQTQFNTGSSFSDVIYRVMLMYKVQNMDAFTLSYAADFTDYQLDTCVNTAVLRNVKQINLCLVRQVNLPPCLFACKTLVDLRLSSGCCIAANGVFNLPVLKKLELDTVRYESEGSVLKLLSGCPVLEELVVHRLEVDENVVCFCVYSSTLVRLVLNSNFNNCEKSFSVAYRVKIDAPALRYLKVYDSLSEDVAVGTVNSLIEADVVLNNDGKVVGAACYSRSVMDFVGELCNVKCLKFSSKILVFSDFMNVRFHNLTKLEVEADWRFISFFIENADNLEVLIIHMVDNDLKRWIEPHVVPTCLSSHLRTMRIDRFGCVEDEFKMVGYFLKNAQVMKRMEIYPSQLSQRIAFDLMKKLDAIKRISLFPRGSVTCEVDFH